MGRFDDADFDFGGREAETKPGPRRPALAIALVVLALAGAAAFHLLRRAPAAPPDPSPAPRAAAERAEPRAPAEPLPPLDASDALLRELARGLSAHPQLASWLVGDDLARRFVTAVVAIAEGESPATPLRPLAPEGAFRARERDGRLVGDDAFRRYDAAAEAVVSIDPDGAAEAYRRLLPLFEEAYREVGRPDRTFEATLAQAVARLRAVPVPDDAELVDDGGVFRWGDPALEHRPAAEKHLLRFGPDNARRIQAKLGELAAAIGLPSA